MLDLKFIRENKDAVKENCKLRNIKCDIDGLLEIYEKNKPLLWRTEKLRLEKNKINDEIMKVSDAEKASLISKGKKIKEESDKVELKWKKKNEEFLRKLLRVPNMSHPDAPIGKDDSENKEIERYGDPPKFDFEPKRHEELMKNLDLVDFERGAKVAGAKFYFLKNEAVLLEQALINYALDICLKEKFTLFVTPDLAKDDIMLGIGFTPRGEETQVYHIENTDLNLIGTAEITMGGYHKDEIINEERLPLKYTALSHCFRTEAGSYGRHSAGLYRVHQFSKVEMFAYTLPEQSQEMHAYIKDLEVKIFQGLGI